MARKEQVVEPVADNKLTPELEAFIRKWKNVPGNLIMVLHKVQEHFGYVPRPVAPTLGIVEGTRAPAPRPRTGASSSPLHEPDSSPEVLTV